jgi:hypothetical protein
MMSSFVVAPREIVGLDSWSIFLVAMFHQTEPVATFFLFSDLVSILNLVSTLFSFSSCKSDPIWYRFEYAKKSSSSDVIQGLCASRMK